MIYGNVVNPLNLFLAMFIFFLLPRVLLDLLNLADIAETTSFSAYRYQEDVIFRSISNLYLAVISFSVGSVIINKEKRIVVNNKIFINSYMSNLFIKRETLSNQSLTQLRKIEEERVNKLLLRIGNIVLMICFPLLIIYLAIIFRFIIENGYIAFHLNESKVPFSAVFKLTSSLALVGYVFMVISNPESKKLYWLYTIFIVICFMADGRRGPGMTILVVSFWYYLYYTNKRIRISKLIMVVLIVILLAIFIGNLRYGKSIDQADFSIFSFIYNQGITFQVVAYTIEYIDKIDYRFLDLFSNVNRMFDVLYHKIIGDIPDLSLETRAVNSKIYSSYISFVVDRDLYLKGFGIGGSYVAQFFAVGKEFGQIIMGVILGALYTYFVNFINSKNFIKKALLIITMPSLIYIPRDNIFDFITDFFFSYIFLLLFYFAIKYNIFVKR